VNIGVKQRIAKLPLHKTDPQGGHPNQMATDKKKDSHKTPRKQGSEDGASEPNKINASTPYDFSGKNLTPYGGLLPVVTLLEKLDFQPLVEQTVTCKRIPRAMDLYRFVRGIVLGIYIGFPRLNQLRFIARDPILTGVRLARPARSAQLTLGRDAGAGWLRRVRGRRVDRQSRRWPYQRV